MNMRILSLMMLLLLSINQSVWAQRLPANLDGDAIADAMEQILMDQGVAGVDPTIVNNYVDTDGTPYRILSKPMSPKQILI